MGNPHEEQAKWRSALGGYHAPAMSRGTLHSWNGSRAIPALAKIRGLGRPAIGVIPRWASRGQRPRSLELCSSRPRAERPTFQSGVLPKQLEGRIQLGDRNNLIGLPHPPDQIYEKRRTSTATSRIQANGSPQRTPMGTAVASHKTRSSCRQRCRWDDVPR